MLSYISGTVVGLPLPFDGPCFPYNNGSRGDRLLGTAYFWIPLAVDVLITAVTLVKCVQLWSSTRLVSSVLQIFVREVRRLILRTAPPHLTGQGLFFFFVVCGCNLINGILLLQTSDPALTNFFAVRSPRVASELRSLPAAAHLPALEHFCVPNGAGPAERPRGRCHHRFASLHLVPPLQHVLKDIARCRHVGYRAKAPDWQSGQPTLLTAASSGLSQARPA